MVGHVGHEVITGSMRNLDPGQVLIDRWFPLIRLAAHEAVELIKALACRPAIGGARRTDFPSRSLVVLAELGGGVTVVTQRLGDAGGIIRNDARVAGIRSRDFRDAAHIDHVMIATSHESGASRRAESGGMKVVIAEAG